MGTRRAGLWSSGEVIHELLEAVLVAARATIQRAFRYVIVDNQVHKLRGTDSWSTLFALEKDQVHIGKVARRGLRYHF